MQGNALTGRRHFEYDGCHEVELKKRWRLQETKVSPACCGQKAEQACSPLEEEGEIV